VSLCAETNDNRPRRNEEREEYIHFFLHALRFFVDDFPQEPSGRSRDALKQQKSVSEVPQVVQGGGGFIIKSLSAY
jgi:hypothetical protein